MSDFSDFCENMGFNAGDPDVIDDLISACMDYNEESTLPEKVEINESIPECDNTFPPELEKYLEWGSEDDMPYYLRSSHPNPTENDKAFPFQNEIATKAMNNKPYSSFPPGLEKYLDLSEDRKLPSCLRDRPHKKSPIKVVNEKRYLMAGTLVHMAKLTSTSPAKLIDARFNEVLRSELSLGGARQLRGVHPTAPAQWFITRGFTVYSMKDKDNWYQVAFKDSHDNTELSEEDQSRYKASASGEQL